jgi:hypothetical protein
MTKGKFCGKDCSGYRPTSRASVLAKPKAWSRMSGKPDPRYEGHAQRKIHYPDLDFLITTTPMMMSIHDIKGVKRNTGVAFVFTGLRTPV